MNIQELKDFFDKSDYSSETGNSISSILAEKTEVTPVLISQIKDILQKELDLDFEELGVNNKDTPEFQKIEKEYTEALETIEKDLENDMAFVDKELKELDEVRKKVSQTSDEIEADKLRQSM